MEPKTPPADGDATAFDSEVSSADAQRELLRAARASGVPDAYAGKRGELRFDFPIPIEIDDGRGGDYESGDLVNVSSGGIAFNSHLCIEEPQDLRIRVWSRDGAHPWIDVRALESVQALRGYRTGAAFVTPLEVEPLEAEDEPVEAVEEHRHPSLWKRLFGG